MAFKREPFDEWLERTTKELSRRNRLREERKPARKLKPKARAKAKLRAVASAGVASADELRTTLNATYARAARRAAESEVAAQLS